MGGAGLKLIEPPGRKQQTSGSPWFDSLHHAIRSFPSTRVSNLAFVMFPSCYRTCHDLT